MLTATPGRVQAGVLADIRRELTRFVQLATRTPLNVRVPASPAISAETLTAHLGRTLRQFQALLAHERDQRIRAPRGPAVIEWTGASLEPVLALLSGALRAGGPASPGARRIGRLLAAEAAIHRWDLESVLGEHTATPPDLAAGQIDTLFAYVVPRLAGSGVPAIGGTVQLRARDLGIDWDVRVTDGRLATRRLAGGRCHADAVVTARAQDLALLLWKRVAPASPRIRVSGSATVLRRFLLTHYLSDPRTARGADQACTANLLPGLPVRQSGRAAG